MKIRKWKLLNSVSKKQDSSSKEHSNRKLVIFKAFDTAFPFTIPICAGYMFLGISYGMLMHAKGFSIWYPILMSILIYSGTMEFITLDLFFSSFDPFSALVLALAVNVRHIFYGLTMLKPYKGAGIKKFFMIFDVTDETFAVNSSAKIAKNVNRQWFMFFVSILNHSYWIIGAIIGWLVGSILPINMKGIEFVLTALFLVIFIEQWRSSKHHIVLILGVVISVVALSFLGAKMFMIPSLVTFLIIFIIFRKYFEKLCVNYSDDPVVSSENCESKKA